jgi:hypothetical protein
MFVAQNQEDYDTLNRFLNDSEGQVLRKGARVNTWFRQKGSIAGPPMNPEEVLLTSSSFVLSSRPNFIILR